MHTSPTRHFAIWAAGAVLSFASARADVIFYGGDADSRTGLTSTENYSAGSSMTYDDFVLKGVTTASAAWGNFFVGGFSLPTQAVWQVRSGVSSGNGGTLVAAGTNIATVTSTGRSLPGFGFLEYQVRVPLSLQMQPGTYWLGIAPFGDGRTQYFVSTTSGMNAGPGGDPNPAPTGGPLVNGNSFLSWANFGFNFTPADASNVSGPGTWDFSYGLEGTTIPEPATAVALLIAPLIARRRRR